MPLRIAKASRDIFFSFYTYKKSPKKDTPPFLEDMHRASFLCAVLLVINFYIQKRAPQIDFHTELFCSLIYKKGMCL